MTVTSRIIAENLHKDWSDEFDWSEEVNPNFLINKLSVSSKERRIWLKGFKLRQINLPEAGDLVPEGLPEWLKDHIKEYRKGVNQIPVYPDRVDYIPTIDEIDDIVVGWGADWLWEWIPQIDLDWEELQSMAQPWMELESWKDALSSNVNRIVRRESIKPHKNF